MYACVPVKLLQKNVFRETAIFSFCSLEAKPLISILSSAGLKYLSKAFFRGAAALLVHELMLCAGLSKNVDRQNLGPVQVSAAAAVPAAGRRSQISVFLNILAAAADDKYCADCRRVNAVTINNNAGNSFDRLAACRFYRMH